ncbi:hypothetical protein FRB99_001749 [Tulasnella sp. 403]|nr:hypothetical protein FRB99_001749 [Tulasnella sp. 403]
MAKKRSHISRSRKNMGEPVSTQPTPPILRLPLEILQLVLTFSLPNCDMFDEDCCAPTTPYYRRLLQLCSVSPYWASFVRNTPSFWTYTSQTDCDELTGAILARSKYSPLHVRYIVHNSCGCQENRWYRHTIVAHSHRWHALSVYTANQGAVKGLLAAPAPLLRYLCVGNMSESLIPMPNPATGPKTVDLDLTKVSLDWASSRLSGIESLQLCEVVPGPTLEQLLDVIQSSPNLHTLAIFGCDIAVASYNTQKTDRNPTQTPRKLDTLKLSDVSTQAMCRILPYVTIHDLSELYLSISESSNLSRDEAVVIVTFASKHLRSLGPCSMAAYIMDGDYCLETDDDKWCITLPPIEGESIKESLLFVGDYLIKAVPGLHDAEATLRFYWDSGDDVLPIMSIMANLLNIVELVFTGPSQMSVLEPLARPLPSGKWLFPNLGKLIVCPYGVVVGDTLPGVVRGRWNASQKGKRGDSKPGVVPIREISVEGGGAITRDAKTWLSNTKLLEKFDLDLDILVVQ